jgi:hypothetical protein
VFSHTPNPDRVLAGKLGGNTRWSRVPTADRPAQTLAARNALKVKWLAEADGDPARAANLEALHYARMAHASVQARRKPQLLKKKLKLEAQLAEVEGDVADLDHGSVA